MADQPLDDRATAAIDLIGRTGATQLELGYLHDDVPTEQAAWWASAHYFGAKVAVENKRSPAHALDALLVRLLAGATCRWCARPVTNRLSKAGGHCRYRRDGDRYVRGCIDTHTETTVPVPPWARST